MTYETRRVVCGEFCGDFLHLPGLGLAMQRLEPVKRKFHRIVVGCTLWLTVMLELSCQLHDCKCISPHVARSRRPSVAEREESEFFRKMITRDSLRALRDDSYYADQGLGGLWWKGLNCCSSESRSLFAPIS